MSFSIFGHLHISSIVSNIYIMLDINMRFHKKYKYIIRVLVNMLINVFAVGARKLAYNWALFFVWINCNRN